MPGKIKSAAIALAMLFATPLAVPGPIAEAATAVAPGAAETKGSFSVGATIAPADGAAAPQPSETTVVQEGERIIVTTEY